MRSVKAADLTKKSHSRGAIAARRQPVYRVRQRYGFAAANAIARWLNGV
jgi:hypothetical protein